MSATAKLGQMNSNHFEMVKCNLHHVKAFENICMSIMVSDGSYIHAVTGTNLRHRSTSFRFSRKKMPQLP